MIRRVDRIIKESFDSIYSSKLSLELLSIYSTLYLNGNQPRYCKMSQLNYYNELCRTGMEKAKKMEEANKVTHKLKKTGIMYVPQPFCKHFNLETLTDKEAESLLKKGFLNKEDFSVLPKKKNDKDAPIK